VVGGDLENEDEQEFKEVRRCRTAKRSRSQLLTTAAKLNVKDSKDGKKSRAQKLGPSHQQYRNMMQRAHANSTPQPKPFIDFDPKPRPMLINGGSSYFPKGQTPVSFVNRQIVDGYMAPYP